MAEDNLTNSTASEPATVETTIETVDAQVETEIEATENAEATPESVETVEEGAETPESGDSTVIAPDESETEAAEDDSEAETEGEEAVADEIALEPLKFEDGDTPEDILAKVSERYELPEDVSAALDRLAKAAATPEPVVPAVIPELEDFGDTQTVLATLEEFNNLTSLRIENDVQRPNTDKFVEHLIEKRPEVADYLAYDLLRQPSLKYAGRTRWEEANIDALARDGDTVETVMKRMETWRDGVLADADPPQSAIPAFIPANLHKAYKALSETSREAIKYLDPEYDSADIAARLDELGKIQRGIDADEVAKAEIAKQRDAQQASYETAIWDTQVRFYAETRKQAAETLKAELGLTQLEAAQRISLLETAFENGPAGDFARSALKAEGIKFDVVKATALVEAMHHAAVHWTNANIRKDDNGRPLDTVLLNRAQRAIEQAGRDWKSFADDIIRQQNAKVGSQAEKKAIAKEAQKQKLALKARPAVKTVGAGGISGPKAPPVGTPEWYDYYADRTLSEAAARAKAYS